ncbi:hypothetical protein COY90_04850 [Candidatus Roizmanbacteria bacterium CG_4_10_14_0_8_um_filter_39_9]|uniref:Nucleotidyl transferase AbiEii/AbiGii toxin family protein n=1 Tax=Candidatus Roizmanbacteria bacterium CG_4_10_14_0_8_um_filter_39_9 TaxID=1974829 RepID=A0A2M7QBQ5_9BACT|nr:MAG: hypothetical protein COY90_04850 [Candidatus Roizmanbacteria bacterium CG_4_10_14_0_8_um_filter_39_9]
MNPLYQRNLIKEELQDVILNFIYNNEKYKELVFTGGTCLRKLYSLPRLSEDLDFDYSGSFDVNVFATEIQGYLVSQKRLFPVEIKIANNRRTVFIKFIQKNKEVIFVRCDFSSNKIKVGEKEVNPYYGEKYNFFIANYNLKTLFTHKIRAFLERVYFKGASQKTSFKGRDLFDIVWFIQFSAKNRFELKPDWGKLESELKKGKVEVIQDIIDKAIVIKKQDVLLDLAPFIEGENELHNFIDTYARVIKAKMRFLL